MDADFLVLLPDNLRPLRRSATCVLKDLSVNQVVNQLLEKMSDEKA